MHWRCADRSAYDVKVPLEQFKSLKSRLLSNRYCTLMSYANRPAQRQCISNKPKVFRITRNLHAHVLELHSGGNWPSPGAGLDTHG